jgi:hypothetical protein
MKRSLATISIAVLFFCAFSAVAAGDILKQLQVAKSDATERIVQAFAHGNVDYWPVRQAFKAATPAARAALVEQVLVWTKAYVNSPQFAKDYAAYREQAKPEAGSSAGVDAEVKKRRAERMAELAEAKKAIAEMPAEYRKAAEEGLKATAEAMKEYDTPEFQKMEREQIAEELQASAADDKERMARWTAEYPADPKVLVKKRLNEFLKETAGVDHAAQVVNKNGRMRFANAAYEQKSPMWKLAYRAGKDATEKARAFAAAWVKEL